MDDVIPLFSTAASLKQGGVFTVEKAGEAAKAGHKRGPVSLCDLAKAEGLKRLHIVDSTMVNFMNAWKNLKEVECDLAFGLKVVVCADLNDKSEASLKTESKVIIFMANDQGYKPLIKLYSRAACDGFYYTPRLDWKSLKELWNENLILALPFYSSFLSANTFSFNMVVPDLPAAPLVLREIGQDHPFDGILNGVVDRYIAANGVPEQAVKSVYYKERDDAKQWLIWQCILSRRKSSYDIPNIDHCHSREFSWQAWKELAAAPTA